MTVICIDCRYIGDKPSGIGEVTEALVRHLPDAAPDLNFLLLRNSKKVGRLSEASNVEEITLKSAANGPATLWWLPRIVDLAQVDLFHAPFNILPAGLNMKTVTTIHDIMWLTHPNWCNPKVYGQIERRFYAKGIGQALDHSNAIATVSNATRSEILNLRPDLERKINVTQSGVSDQFRKVALDHKTREAVGLKPNQRFVLTAGQFAPYKNHEGALRAFAKAFNSHDDISLVMVQRRGAGAKDLAALAHELGIAARVHFTGPVSFSELLQLYSGALALLHPSLCEGFGNPIAEAMACGCPVITSNQSAMPEVTSGAGLLVNPLDTQEIGAALRRVAFEPELAKALSEKGLSRAKELTWKRFAQQNLDIYRKLLA